MSPAPSAPVTGGADRAARLATIVIAVCSALIVLPFRWPPMWDASHHIATPWVMARVLAGDPFFSEHFAVHLVPLPYWLTTLGVGLLMPVFGPCHGFAVMCAAYVLALPLSFAWLQRSWRLEQPLALPLVALLAFCQPYWAGLTNFVFGLPLLLCALAAWARVDGRSRRGLLLFFGVVTLLYLAHVYLVAMLFGLLALWAILSRLSGRRRWDGLGMSDGPRLAALAIAGAFFVLGAYMVLVYPGEDANSGPLVWALTPWRVPAIVARAFGSPTFRHPWYLVAVVPAALAAFVPLIRRPREVLSGPRLAAAAGALALAALACLGPANMEDGLGHTVEDIAQRFELPAVLLGLLAMPRLEGRAWRGLVLATAVVFAPIKLADVVGWYRTQDGLVGQFVARIAPAVREESRVLAVTAPDASHLDWRHRLMNYTGNYLLIERHAYVSSLFAARGQQPLSHRATGEHRLILDHRVRDHEWSEFDYLLVQTDVEHPAIPGLDEHAVERASSEQFRLYEIVR